MRRASVRRRRGRVGLVVVDAGQIIDALGGTAEAARFFEIRPSSVSDWRREGIPQARLRHLRDVRPDLFVQPAAPAVLAATTNDAGVEVRDAA